MSSRDLHLAFLWAWAFASCQLTLVFFRSWSVERLQVYPQPTLFSIPLFLWVVVQGLSSDVVNVFPKGVIYPTQTERECGSGFCLYQNNRLSMGIFRESNWNNRQSPSSIPSRLLHASQ